MQKTFAFTEDVFVDTADGKSRVLAKKGTEFAAEMADETVVDRTGIEPKAVKTGRKYVESADIDVHPGCLTSCVRTGRAVAADSKPRPAAPVKPEPPTARRKPKKTAAVA